VTILSNVRCGLDRKNIGGCTEPRRRKRTWAAARNGLVLAQGMKLLRD
jgi:hypothetical protein